MDLEEQLTICRFHLQISASLSLLSSVLSSSILAFIKFVYFTWIIRLFDAEIFIIYLLYLSSKELSKYFVKLSH